MQSAQVFLVTIFLLIIIELGCYLAVAIQRGTPSPSFQRFKSGTLETFEPPDIDFDRNFVDLYKTWQANIHEFKKAPQSTLVEKGSTQVAALKNFLQASSFDKTDLRTYVETMTWPGLPPYQVTYHTDRFFRRTTPTQRQVKAFRLALMGGSYVFGANLDYHHTLGFYIEKAINSVNVDNLGYPGWGPADTLAALKREDIDFLQDIDAPTMSFIYIFPSFHIERMILQSDATLPQNRWLLDKPRFSFLTSKLIRDGTLRNSFWLPIYDFFHRTSFSKASGVVFSEKGTQKTNHYVIRVFQEIEQELQSRKKNTRFHVLIYPNWTRKGLNQLLSDMSAAGLSIIDLSALPIDEITSGRTYFPWDYHPTPLGNQTLTHAIQQWDIKKQKIFE